MDPDRTTVEVRALARLDIGNGGWCRYTSPDFYGPVFIRFADDAKGQLSPVELYMGPDTPIERALSNVRIARAVQLARKPANAADLRRRIRWADQSKVIPTVAVEVRKPFDKPLPAKFEHPVELVPTGRLPTKDTVPLDDFYREVARVYAELAPVVAHPAQHIYEANRWVKSITSVYEWVKQARKRGYLPPVGRGRTF